MKLIRPRKTSGPDSAFTFRLTETEKDMLMATLKLYPMLDGDYHRLSRAPQAAGDAEQEWLEEAMNQQRIEHRKRLELFFKHDQRFFKNGAEHLRLTLTAEQMEWLLRVLNDVRVGSWVRLGRPEMESCRMLAQNEQKARYVASMELSGYFVSALLEAFV